MTESGPALLALITLQDTSSHTPTSSNTQTHLIPSRIGGSFQCGSVSVFIRISGISALNFPKQMFSLMWTCEGLT